MLSFSSQFVASMSLAGHFAPSLSKKQAHTDAVPKCNHFLDLESMQAIKENVLSICMQLQVPLPDVDKVYSS